MAGEHLTGRYRVRAITPAIREVSKLVDRMSDNIAIRRHALKLRYWPDHHPESDSGQVLDLDWEWIRGLSRVKTSESCD